MTPETTLVFALGYGSLGGATVYGVEFLNRVALERGLEHPKYRVTRAFLAYSFLFWPLVLLSFLFAVLVVSFRAWKQRVR